jgi:predicted RNase H-like HicB family nuclease
VIVNCTFGTEDKPMPVHLEVLEAARRLCRERGGWTFRPDEAVRALPHLNASTIRTHVVSRCCVNAPKHHPHRWAYFRRTGRGTYEILPAVRRGRARPPGASTREGTNREGAQSPQASAPRLGETMRTYDRRTRGAPADTVHAVVTRDRDWYTAECLEVAVVTQGRTLDELVVNLKEAVTLHLEGEEPAHIGVVPGPRISLTYDMKGRTG